MPIQFALIPKHLQFASIKKLNFDDFVNLQLTSKSVAPVSKLLKTWLPLKVKRAQADRIKKCITLLELPETHTAFDPVLPIIISFKRLGDLKVMINTDVLEINTFVGMPFELLGMRIKVSKLKWSIHPSKAYYGDPSYSSNRTIIFNLSNVNRIVEALSVEHLELEAPDLTYNENTDLSGFEKLSSVTIMSIIDHNAVHAFKCSRIKIKNNEFWFSPEQLNKFLKGTKNQYFSFCVQDNPQFFKDLDSTSLEGLSYVILWNKAIFDKRWCRRSHAINSQAYVVTNQFGHHVLHIDVHKCFVKSLKCKDIHEAVEEARKLLK